MVYITGEPHGEIEHLLQRICELKPGENDTIIIPGDFGFVFSGNELENSVLDRLAECPCTLAFIDGNHDNINLLMRFPVGQWNGGAARKIRHNIVYLQRGELYTIEGKTFFTFGGAGSTDAKLRTPGKNWWNEEIPSIYEFSHGTANLARNSFHADYIITHTAPSSIARLCGRIAEEERELEEYLEWIKDNVSYKKWFFGHFHKDMQFRGNLHLIYNKPVLIQDD